MVRTQIHDLGESPSSRRAWIEMCQPREPPSLRAVALLTEGVDRNRSVALIPCPSVVALLAEGVDRNAVAFALPLRTVGSPSSRRAWIEIYVKKTNPRTDLVALLTEGVDRNLFPLRTLLSLIGSPPSRRAWIEIK